MNKKTTPEDHKRPQCSIRNLNILTDEIDDLLDHGWITQELVEKFTRAKDLEREITRLRAKLERAAVFTA